MAFIKDKLKIPKNKIKKVLSSPITVRDVVVFVGTLIAAILLLGAAPAHQKALVVHAQTLNPTPIPAATPAYVVKTVPATQAATIAPQQGSWGDMGLIGSLGWSSPFGNCVNEPGVKRQPGNPISWRVTTQTPYVGATALFWFNHVGVVSGIWSNGDIEIHHQNCPCPHRYPRSMFRGFV